MSDQPNTPPETPPAATIAPVPEPEIPTDRPPENVLKEAMRRASAAETEAAALRKWKDEQEAAQLSEIERAQKAAEDASKLASTNEQRATTAERRFDVWKAAHAAGFEDPEDAVVYLKDRFDGLDSAEKIKKAVEDLAEAKPKLLGSGHPPTPTPIGGLTPQTPSGEIPVGPDGKPDVKAGIGRDLLSGLLGRS